ncbi:MAG: ribbon-helix-helix domain-containing protein [Proteobacteria bacterium]|nr:ribbon-helix-helix domain-containing protein [Pseudomonadota bacterium]
MIKPKKRSIFIKKKRTSISLEEEFWRGLLEIARIEKRSLASLWSEITETSTSGNLSSATRVWILAYFRNRSGEATNCGMCNPSVGAVKSTGAG